jgi:hypothetical protein
MGAVIWSFPQQERLQNMVDFRAAAAGVVLTVLVAAPAGAASPPPDSTFAGQDPATVHTVVMGQPGQSPDAQPIPDGARVVLGPPPATSPDGGQVIVRRNLVTNGPVPDTPANRDKYGHPLSRTGQQTPPAGN